MKEAVLHVHLSFTRHPDSVEVYQFLKPMGRKKSSYVIAALEHYYSHSVIRNIDQLLIILHKFQYIRNTYQLNTAADIDQLMSSYSENSQPEEKIDENTMRIGIQFNSGNPNQLMIYQKLMGAEYKVDEVIAAIKHYQVVVMNQEYLKVLSERLLREVAIEYRKSDKSFIKLVQGLLLSAETNSFAVPPADICSGLDHLSKTNENPLDSFLDKGAEAVPNAPDIIKFDLGTWGGKI